MLIPEIHQYFLLKKCEKLLSFFQQKKDAKASHIFTTKNVSVFGYKVLKHLTSWLLNELVKLTMLWTTGSRLIRDVLWFCKTCLFPELPVPVINHEEADIEIPRSPRWQCEHGTVGKCRWRNIPEGHCLGLHATSQVWCTVWRHEAHHLPGYESFLVFKMNRYTLWGSNAAIFIFVCLLYGVLQTLLLCDNQFIPIQTVLCHLHDSLKDWQNEALMSKCCMNFGLSMSLQAFM